MCAWLVAVGLQKHAPCFLEHDVGGALLCKLTLEDLCEDMGVSRLHAKGILRHRDDLLAMETGDSSASYI